MSQEISHKIGVCFNEAKRNHTPTEVVYMETCEPTENIRQILACCQNMFFSLQELLLPLESPCAFEILIT